MEIRVKEGGWLVIGSRNTWSYSARLVDDEFRITCRYKPLPKDFNQTEKGRAIIAAIILTQLSGD